MFGESSISRHLLVNLLIVLFESAVFVAPSLAQDGYWHNRYVNVHDFLSGEGATPPELSPDGRFLAQMLYQGVSSPGGELVIRDLDSPGQPEISRTDLTGFDVLYMVWANNQRLLTTIRTSGFVQAGGQRIDVPVIRTISFDPYDTSRPIVLFQNEGRRVFQNVNNAFWSAVVDLLPGDDSHILMPAYRDRTLDLWRVNVFTGDADLVERGRERTAYWFTNSRGQAAMRVDVGSSGRRVNVFTRAPDSRSWRRSASYLTNELIEAAPEFDFAGHGENPEEIIIFGRPDDTDKTGLYAFDLAAGEYGPPLVLEGNVDITRTIIDSRSRQLLGYVRSDGRTETVLFDPALDRHYQQIAAHFDDDLTIVPRGFRGDRMMIHVSGPREAGALYFYDASTGEITHVYSSRPNLHSSSLNDVEVLNYTSRDGVALQAYLTLPAQGTGPDTPLVVMPHGGPEARDEYGYDMIAQYFAANGYAILQPNFRGSAGYGRAFAEAGYGEWGGRMQQDIDDAISAVITAGRVDGDRVCIAGFSYGGYAALIGGAQRPDFYDCVFAGAPVTNLVSFVEHWQEHNEAAAEYWERAIGHPRRDRARLEAVSPVNLADRFSMPVLIAHGMRDEIVPFEQSQAMAGALRSEGVMVDFAIYDRSGHQFTRRADMSSVLRLAVQLFDRTIGPDRGRYENVFTGERIETDSTAPKSSRADRAGRIPLKGEGAAASGERVINHQTAG